MKEHLALPFNCLPTACTLRVFKFPIFYLEKVLLAYLKVSKQWNRELFKALQRVHRVNYRQTLESKLLVVRRLAVELYERFILLSVSKQTKGKLSQWPYYAFVALEWLVTPFVH